ncbi:response regulator transcription factor [Bradyrhizobium tropiciagri]|nr:response regulator transcription factor [Bradyrhizobium tropiciagri]MBR0874894.1 response regulator transcription factor [Bradyrhizobium tropiciagri]
MRRTRLLIADRHPVVLEGLASALAAAHDFEIVASCSDGASCVEAIRTSGSDIALLEGAFPDVSRAEILAVIDGERLATRVVFFAAEDGDLDQPIAAGACSVISKSASLETLVHSLRVVADGGSLPPGPAPDAVPAGKEANGIAVDNLLAVLTEREREIMRLVSEGLSNKGVARRLNLSQGTIKVHLHHIFRKLEINNRTVLAALAVSQR